MGILLIHYIYMISVIFEEFQNGILLVVYILGLFQIVPLWDTIIHNYLGDSRDIQLYSVWNTISSIYSRNILIRFVMEYWNNITILLILGIFTQ